MFLVDPQLATQLQAKVCSKIVKYLEILANQNPARFSPYLMRERIRQKQKTPEDPLFYHFGDIKEIYLPFSELVSTVCYDWVGYNLSIHFINSKGGVQKVISGRKDLITELMMSRIEKSPVLCNLLEYIPWMFQTDSVMDFFYQCVVLSIIMKLAKLKYEKK